MKLEIKEKKLYEVIQGAKSSGQDEITIMFKEDRWLLKTMSPSDVIMFGAVVPESEMESYNRGNVEEIGINLISLDQFIGKSDNTVSIERIEVSGGIRKFQIVRGNSVLEEPLINIDLIDGRARSVPDIDYAVKFETDPSFIKDFVGETDNITGAGSFMISPREGFLYLYARHDDRTNWNRVHWEDLDNVQIDWSKGFYEDQNHKNPEEEHAIDTLLSVEWFKDINLISDKATVYIDNHCPLKMVFDTGGDIKASYFVSPRLNTSGEVPELPDRIVKDRGV